MEAKVQSPSFTRRLATVDLNPIPKNFGSEL